MVAEDDLRLQLYAIAPAPCRDYYGLTITGSQIILNVWNVSYGPHMYPKRHKALLQDFNDETLLQQEIRSTFGEHVLDFCKSLANNEHSLQYLPTKIFLKIIKMLATKDILALSQTSKIFFELCNTDAVWKIIFRKKIRRPIARDDCKSALDVGWKKLLMKKMLLRKKVMRTSITDSKLKNNAKAIGNKPNNVDVIQNVKRASFSKNLCTSIAITELRAKDVNKKNDGRAVVQNFRGVNTETRNVRSANVRNVNISGNSIRNHLNSIVSSGNLRQKNITPNKIGVKK